MYEKGFIQTAGALRISFFVRMCRKFIATGQFVP